MSNPTKPKPPIEGFFDWEADGADEADKQAELSGEKQPIQPVAQSPFAMPSVKVADFTTLQQLGKNASDALNKQAAQQPLTDIVAEIDED